MSERYYSELAAAFVRARLPMAPDLPDRELADWGRAQGLELHKFKRNASLPRVRRALGWILGLQPRNLLDIGSGRGVFLWPLLDSMPDLPTTTVEIDPIRVRDLKAVASSVERFDVVDASVLDLPFEDRSFDVVTMLEVLEHLKRPEAAAAEILRVADRHVIVSVPSKPDDNPQHIQLFGADRMRSMLLGAGARNVKIDWVRSHLLAFASK